MHTLAEIQELARLIQRLTDRSTNLPQAPYTAASKALNTASYYLVDYLATSNESAWQLANLHTTGAHAIIYSAVGI